MIDPDPIGWRTLPETAILRSYDQMKLEPTRDWAPVGALIGRRIIDVLKTYPNATFRRRRGV